METVCKQCGNSFRARQGWIAPTILLVLDVAATLLFFHYGEWGWGLLLLMLVIWNAHVVLKNVPFGTTFVVCGKCAQKANYSAENDEHID
jgi:hypothetical protein